MHRHLFALLVFASTPAFARDTAVDVREAVAKPIALLQRTAVRWFDTQQCASCHQQDLPMMVLRLADERGVPVNEDLRRQAVAKGYGYLASLDRAVQHPYLIDPSLDYGMHLLGAHDAGVAPNLSTAVYARLIANRQKADGHWITVDERPPQAHSVFSATAIAMRAVQLYMPTQLRSEASERVTRARQWLLSNQPATTEDRVFQLRGLAWAGTDRATLARLAARLVAEQRGDGGWAQLPRLESDAYATGEVLVVLREAAQTPASDPAWQKGMRYLQRTQLADGSWRVKSRMHEQEIVSPKYFETGFPHGVNQVISAMGTSWAAAALLLALEPARNGSSASDAKQPAVSPVTTPWMAVALFGTPAELKALLDGGLDANSSTSDGTTLLMMSAHDAAKVRLLLDRGARVNARAKTGFTALMVAANYTGATEAVRLLLSKGADTRDGEPKPQFNASAVFYSVFSGDTDKLDALAATPADLRRKMTVLGFAPTRPIDIAVAQRDIPMIRYLASHGVDVNQDDPDIPVSPLSGAVMENDIPTARALLALHADPNKVDAVGMTPVLHAAAVDFGDTEMITLLLSAGGNRQARTKAQQTPEQLAQLYGHADIARVLAGH
jgi:N-acyl-D-amino-acid deacylase